MLVAPAPYTAGPRRAIERRVSALLLYVYIASEAVLSTPVARVVTEYQTRCFYRGEQLYIYTFLLCVTSVRLILFPLCTLSVVLCRSTVFRDAGLCRRWLAVKSACAGNELLHLRRTCFCVFFWKGISRGEQGLPRLAAATCTEVLLRGTRKIVRRNLQRYSRTALQHTVCGDNVGDLQRASASFVWAFRCGRNMYEYAPRIRN